MLQTLTAGGKKFKIDPETNFWGLGDDRALETLYLGVREEILAEMKEFRFATDILLLYVNPTDACNARCAYCYLPQTVKSRGRSMSLDELDVLVQKARAYYDAKGVIGSVIFHGTEPLLIKQTLFEIFGKYRGQVHFGIQTNGTLLTPEDAAFLRENHVNVGVSLDSPFEGTNDALRGEGHFHKVDRVLDWFAGYKGLNVVTTITSRNVLDLSAMVRYLSGKGVGLCLMNPVRGTQEPARDLRPACRILSVEFIAAVEEAIRRTKEGRRIVIGDFANVLLGIVAPAARMMMCDVSPCGGGRRFFSVTADGNTWPCGEFIGMDEFRGGNILQDAMDDIVASGPFESVRRRRVEDIPECRDCALRNVCGAPCPAEMHATEGTMYAKSAYCEFYQDVARHAFEVIARDDVGHVIRQSALRETYRM